MARSARTFGWALAAVLLASATAEAATVNRSVFGTAADGQTVYLFTLKNHHGMTVRFSTRGGSIVEISAPDRRGAAKNLVIGRYDFKAWEGGANPILGRYANRIGGGGFTLDGVFYKLAGADPQTQVVTHAGPIGFNQKLWTGETFQQGERAGATLTYVSADGENGFPGELTVKASYSLGEDNVLRLEYRATTTKPTVLNLTNSTHFNLCGYDCGPAYDQILQVFAGRYTPTDQNQVPTGELASVAGTPFDFRTPRRIGESVYSSHPQMLLAKGLDHNFVLDKPAGQGTLTLAARMYDPKTGRRLEVRTTEPGLQIHSANGANGTNLGQGGRTLRQGDGLSLETQHFPDSPNKPNFPSTVLRPGETFRSVTEYAFSTDGKSRTP
ncbi:MAG TPA: aldose epimerase family protein [Caulobacteraceae bacterium]|nr:aldose epimerase family protein [Caulobacteraceae bacterium]